MASYRYQVGYTHRQTGNLHSTLEVVAPDEVSAARLGDKKFANINGLAPAEFYSRSVTEVEAIPSDEVVADDDDVVDDPGDDVVADDGDIIDDPDDE